MDLLTRTNERLVHYVHYVQDGSRSLHGRPGSGISVAPGPSGYCLCPGPPSPHSSSALPHALRPYAPQAWAGDLCDRGDDSRSARADHPLSALHRGRGTPIPRTVHFHQAGSMRLSRGADPVDLEAEHWYTTSPPGFVWDGLLKRSFVPLARARDRYSEGRGSMYVRAEVETARAFTSRWNS